MGAVRAGQLGLTTLGTAARGGTRVSVAYKWG